MGELTFSPGFEFLLFLKKWQTKSSNLKLETVCLPILFVFAFSVPKAVGKLSFVKDCKV